MLFVLVYHGSKNKRIGGEVRMRTKKEVKAMIIKNFEELAESSSEEITREELMIRLTRLSVLHWMLGETDE